MKILFLTHPRGTPSTEWRIAQFVEHWRAAGVECVFEGDPAGADLVVLQKKLLSLFPFRRLRKAARRLIYEFDDAVMFERDGADVRPSRTRMGRWRRIVRAADAVTTSNVYLADLAAREKALVRVFPNAIDLRKWTPRSTASAAHRIGWFGSPANLDQLAEIAGPMERLLARRPEVEFVVVSERPGPIGRHVPYGAARENEEIASFDVAVAPMPDTPWTRGKTPVKLLCYLACGVPVVASDVPPHRALLADGITALMPRDAAGWERALEALIEDAAARDRLATAGLDLVRGFYTSEKMAKAYLDFYRQVAG